MTFEEYRQTDEFKEAEQKAAEMYDEMQVLLQNLKEKAPLEGDWHYYFNGQTKQFAKFYTGGCNPSSCDGCN